MAMVHSYIAQCAVRGTSQLLREEYSFTNRPMAVARYSFIQLSEIWQRGANAIGKVEKRQQEESNLGFVD